MNMNSLSSQLGILLYNTMELYDNYKNFSNNYGVLENYINIIDSIGYNNLNKNGFHHAFIEECLNDGMSEVKAEQFFIEILNEYIL